MLGFPLWIFFLLIVATGIIIVVWMMSRSSKRPTTVISQTISNSHVIPIDSSIWTSRWIDSVVGADGLELFLPGQNLILYGAESTGRSVLMTRAVEAVNSRFATTRDAAIYVDMRGIISLANPQPWLSI